MEARLVRVFVLAVCPALLGATYQSRTENFVVLAPTQEIAIRVGRTAEHFRKQLAVEWLGHELPRWDAPCPIRVKVGQIGAGGQTTFSFFPNGNGSAEVSNWDMQIQGSLERILDSVLPHEVSHTIFACHFRRPLPRWADEGAATLAEHESEKREQVLRLKQVIGTRRRIALKNLFNIKEYPTDPQDLLTLYAEGYSVAELLVQERGRARYLKFLADANRYGWEKAVHTHYGYRGVEDFEKRWYTWVMAGSPELELPKGQQLADASKDRRPQQQEPIIRGQSPTEDPFLNEPSTTLLATATVENRDDSRNVSGALQMRAAPTRRQENAPEMPAFSSVGKTASLKQGPSRRSLDIDSACNATISDWPTVGQKSARVVPRKNPQRVEAVEGRISALPRQATEWSEFPQDPRPSPLILRGRR
jgi:hypothetical protein